MRISLVHNKDAGNGVSPEVLREAIKRAGHELVQMVEKGSGFARVLEKSTDLVVAAGGDGTVSTVASAVAGRGIPVAIVPLGTANNIARSLGIEGSISQVIGNWSGAHLRTFDVGVARDGWGESRFLEAVGGGLIPAGIAAMSGRRIDEQEDLRSKLARAVRTYREVLSRLKARRCTLTLDGTRLCEDLLVLEVLNTRLIGPNLMLSPDVDSSDGFFSVVSAGEEHRECLAEYLRHRIEGTDCRLCLPTLRARQVEIQGWPDVHVDDKVRSDPSMGTVSICIEPAALRFLV